MAYVCIHPEHMVIGPLTHRPAYTCACPSTCGDDTAGRGKSTLLREMCLRRGKKGMGYIEVCRSKLLHSHSCILSAAPLIRRTLPFTVLLCSLHQWLLLFLSLISPAAGPRWPSSVAGKVPRCCVIMMHCFSAPIVRCTTPFLSSKLFCTCNQTHRCVTSGVSTGRATPQRLWQKLRSCSGLQLPGAHGHAESAGGPHGGPPCAQGRLPPDDFQTVTCTTAAVHQCQYVAILKEHHAQPCATVPATYVYLGVLHAECSSLCIFSDALEIVQVLKLGWR